MIKIFLRTGCIFFMAISIIGCSDNTEEIQTETDPEIIQIRTNTNWNLATTDYNVVEVQVNDPQGIEDIKSVIIKIKNDFGTILIEDSLHDDGAYFHPNDGDVLAGDGIFSNQYDARTDVDSIAGNYSFEIVVTDFDGNNIRSDEQDIKLGYSYKTEFRLIESPDTLKSGGEDTFFYITLFHQKGVAAISEVAFKLYDSGLTNILQEREMYNNGDFEKSGDIMAEDSIFSFRVKNSFAAGRLGLYQLIFEVSDQFGQQVESSPIPIFIENEIGNILEVNVPDQLEKPSTQGSYTIGFVTASIYDPQGLNDVDSVYFFSKKPNGEMANSGNPLVMVDNGKPFNINNAFEEAGDETADDGVYSLSILLDSNAQTGFYHFNFYMRDKVGHLTPVKMDSVEVY